MPPTSPNATGAARRPDPEDAAPYYFRYIDRVPGDDVLAVLAAQAAELPALLDSVSEERSSYRYGPEKWTIRGVWSHVNDCERVFAYRALWFARGFDTALPSFDEKIAAASAGADDRTWASHVAEFRALRAATRELFEGLPPEAWDRRGIASDLPFTVRALAFIAAGHAAHHAAILRERYLGG